MALRNIARDENKWIEDVQRRTENVFADSQSSAAVAAELRHEPSRAVEPSAPPMSNYVRMEDERDETWKEWGKRKLRLAGFYVLIALIILLLVGSLLQELCYWLGTWGCNPSALEGFEDPFGNDMVPDDLILLEEYHYFWKVFLATKTDVQGLKKDMVVGYFYQIWGPFAYTTAFRDSFGHTLFASVRNLIHLGSSNSIYRCDGKDEVYTLTESNNWLMNKVRRLFGSFRSSEYDIYRGDELVAVSDKIGYSTKSLLIHYPKSEDPIAEASLTARNIHGSYDEWIIHQSQPTKELTSTSLPAFVSAMTTSLMAFAISTKKPVKKKKPSPGDDDTPTLAAAPPPRLRVIRNYKNENTPLIAASTTSDASAEVAPAQDAPAEVVPAQDAPAEVVPAHDAPAEVPAQDSPAEVPAQDAPAEVPAQDAPAEVVPAEDAPAEVPAQDALAEVPAQDAPAEVPAQDAPAEVPAQDAPAEVVPAQDASAEAPAQDAPAEVVPAQDAPAEVVPAQDAPAEVVPAQDAPAEVPAQDAPAEVAPAQDAPAEVLAQDAPADVPVQDAPAEVAPAQNAPAEVPAQDAPAEIPVQAVKDA